MTIRIIFPSSTKILIASSFLIPAFSISSIKIIGEMLILATSETISALLCPPDKFNKFISGRIASPVILFASSITSSISPFLALPPRDSKCNCRKSLTDISVKKFMLCASEAINFLFGSDLISLSGISSLTKIFRLLLVSTCANLSMS